MKLMIYKILLLNLFFPSILSYSIGNVNRLPGQGYDSILNEFKRNCLSGEINQFYYTGQNTNGNNYYFNKTASEIVRKLKVSDNSINDFGVSLHSELSSNSTNLSIVYDSFIQGKSAVLAVPILTDLGKSVIDLSLNEKRKTCGDKFVSGIDLGARFIINIKLYFKNEETKNNFIYTFTDYEIWHSLIENMVNENFKQFKNNLLISINAFQYGGDKKQFQNFIEDLGLQRSCTVDDFQNCNTFLFELISYRDKKFYDQLNNMSYSLDSDKGPAVFSYEFSQYLKLGFPYLDSGLIDNLEIQEGLNQKKSLKDFQDRIDYEYQNNKRSEQLILNKKTFLLDNSRFDSIQKIFEYSKENLNHLKLEKEKCINNYSCFKNINTILSKIINYDLNILNVY